MPGPRRPGHRFRYGPWHGGPDPLAPPYDVRAAVDRLGEQVLAGGSLREALRDLLDRGLGPRPGLTDLAERARRLRQAAARRGDLAGMLDQVRGALDQVLATERDQLGTEEGDAARLAELELATVPDDVAGAVQALAGYRWHSAEAQEGYERIRQRLQREALDAQLAGLGRALAADDPAGREARQRVTEMLGDLNALLAAHARGEDTTEQFAEFMERHGDLFPEQPRDVDELVDALARRRAAADRLLASLPPEQRDALDRLMQQALADPDLAAQMAQLADNLRTLRPGLERSPVPSGEGGEPLGYQAAVEAVAELAELEELERQLGQDYPGASLDDVDVAALERRLGAGAVADLEGLRALERELEEQGYLARSEGAMQLTPRAVRRLGETALRRVFAHLEADAGGEHADHRTGSADEPTGSTRAWTFGDELPVDAVRTVANAVRRGGPVPGRLQVEDFEVVETERRAGAAVALCVDLSFSMVHEGRWGPMKQTALALSHLVATRFRQDALQVVGFDLAARRLTPVQLAAVEPEWVQGTNLQHALMIAGRHLHRHPDAEPVVLVVTDGEPTAHLSARGEPVFHWPPAAATVRATVAQVDELARYGATLNLFRLGDDPGLARFTDALARRAGGRVFTPDPSRLGEYVVADYLRARRGRR